MLEKLNLSGLHSAVVSNDRRRGFLFDHEFSLLRRLEVRYLLSPVIPTGKYGGIEYRPR